MKIKSKLTDLAVFGAPPRFDKKLHVGRPNIGDRRPLLKRLDDILDREWLTNNGHYVQEFERKIAGFVGVKHCVVTCNATLALQLVIEALGLTGEVIIPSMTFVATPHAIQWRKLKPAFADIDPETWNLDPARVEEAISPDTSAIIGVHLFGRPCNIDALEKISRRYNLKLLFDAAHAFGCSAKGRMIGGFGEAEVFSFHATKFFNSLEGGAVVTNKDDLAEKVRLMRNFGFSGYDQVDCLGINAKMNEFSAAMGLTSFESLTSFVETNTLNYKLYEEELAGLPGVTLMRYEPGEQSNFQYIVLKIDEAATRISRDEIAEVLWAENVFARRYFYPGCHRMEPYRSLYPEAGKNLPETEKIVGRLLCLPTGRSVGPEEIKKLCSLIRICIAQGREISRELSRREPEGPIPA